MSKKLSSIIIWFTAFALLAYFNKNTGCFKSNTSIDNKTADKQDIAIIQKCDSLNKIVPGIYKGKFYSSTNIPAAGIHPGYTSYEIEIATLSVKLKDTPESVNDLGLAPGAYLVSDLFAEAKDASGDTMSIKGLLILNPITLKACFVAPGNSNIMGGHPCEFTYNEGEFISERGKIIKQ